jgi:septal ring factor EnvC (AmiA/AmiB activator)
MVSDATELTREDIAKRRSRLRRFLGSHPNLLTWILPVAAFLFGVTLSAAAFVGVWRSTASEADRAHANATAAARQLAQAGSQVKVLQSEVRNAESGLAAARAALARSRGRQRALAEKLAAAEQANNSLAARLPDQLAAVEATAGSLARRSASLASALSGLQSYLAHGGSGIDPAFVKLQIQYVIRASAQVQTGTGELETRVSAAVKTASNLMKIG